MTAGSHSPLQCRPLQPASPATIPTHDFQEAAVQINGEARLALGSGHELAGQLGGRQRADLEARLEDLEGR